MSSFYLSYVRRLSYIPAAYLTMLGAHTPHFVSQLSFSLAELRINTVVLAAFWALEMSHECNSPKISGVEQMTLSQSENTVQILHQLLYVEAADESYIVAARTHLCRLIHIFPLFLVSARVFLCLVAPSLYHSMVNQSGRLLTLFPSLPN